MAEIQRLQSDAGATLPLPSAMAAIAAVPASGRGLQNRSQATNRTQVGREHQGQAVAAHMAVESKHEKACSDAGRSSFLAWLSQVSDGSPGRATPPRSAAPAARRPRPRRQPRATTAEAAAPASPASTRTYSDRTVGRRQPPTPEVRVNTLLLSPENSEHVCQPADAHVCCDMFIHLQCGSHFRRKLIRCVMMAADQ